MARWALPGQSVICPTLTFPLPLERHKVSKFREQTLKNRTEHSRGGRRRDDPLRRLAADWLNCHDGATTQPRTVRITLISPRCSAAIAY